MNSLRSVVPILAAEESTAALVTFVVYTLGVFALAAMANRLLKQKSFLSEYFLGSRGLGMWAFALTFAATSASGGSFTGFPAKIYTHGWILALWIASYMVVPICTMGLIGKRVNQVARISGAITMPDVLRDRYESRGLGLLSTILIVFFLVWNLVAQFKAGSEILRTLLADVELFDVATAWTGAQISGWEYFDKVEPSYLLCLMAFGVSVIVYTAYGGFHAVVWTDVMQGVVMVLGVAVMLPLALMQVGGLEKATQEIARMQPPRIGYASMGLEVPVASSQRLRDEWFLAPDESGELTRVCRVSRDVTFEPGERIVENVRFVELTTPEEVERQMEALRTPAAIARMQADLRGVAESQRAWENAEGPVEGEIVTDAQLDALPMAVLNHPDAPVVRVTVDLVREYAYGAGETGGYVSGPAPVPPTLPATADGPLPDESAASVGFLPLGVAISFFFMWAISGSGQPQYMVRLMAFKDSRTLTRAIMTVTVYYSLIYFPLVIIFVCARVLMPGMEGNADAIMPSIAVLLTKNVGAAWLGGLLVAAPFAAVMSTVDSFLLVISSAVVRDIYQRNINPDASERTIKWISYITTFSVGMIALVGAIKPPEFLQDIIVYVGSGLAACFLFPVIAGLYWKRSNLAGCVAGMLGGFAAHLSMHLIGMAVNGRFVNAYRLFGMDPVVIGLFASLVCVLVVTPITPAPSETLVRRYFYRESGQGSV